ncbi:MAG: hypothetical protein NZ853_08765 [Leptospiraceae bacterium]|nr:hypothetical protein [Leptospiraceae bacterium]MDW7976733.1 hypothetical protein [Leptospiraceae bacterium]
MEDTETLIGHSKSENIYDFVLGLLNQRGYTFISENDELNKITLKEFEEKFEIEIPEILKENESE